MRRSTPSSSSRPLGRSVLEALAGLLAVLVALGLLGSCSGPRATLGSVAPHTTTEPKAVPPTDGGGSPSTSSTTTPPPVTRTLGVGDLLGYIATPKGTPAVYSGPSITTTNLDVPSKTEAGAPTTFAIVGDASPSATLAHPGWLEVELPSRPNGSTGWVQLTSVTVTKTPLRVFVDLEGREIRVEDDGRKVFSAEVAIGTTQNPTPEGATFVTELIQNTKPTGSYGPYAFGLALHSDTLTEFQGGDGQVGIHGTNHPELIGDRVSHGCVRLANADINELVDLKLPLGVPVFIT